MNKIEDRIAEMECRHETALRVVESMAAIYADLYGDEEADNWRETVEAGLTDRYGRMRGSMHGSHNLHAEWLSKK